MYHSEKTDRAFPELRSQRELDRPRLSFWQRTGIDPLNLAVWGTIIVATAAFWIVVLWSVIDAVAKTVIHFSNL